MHLSVAALNHTSEPLRLGPQKAKGFRTSTSVDVLMKGTARLLVPKRLTGPQRSGPARSPLVATPRKGSQPQPYATRKWRTPTVEARPSSPIACAMCGEPVLKRRRSHCEACMPKARREHGLRAIEAARKALAVQAAARSHAGPYPAQARRGQRRAASAQSSLGARASGQRDEAWFKREIVPKLDSFSLKEIADATGLSLAACSRIRAGRRVPHTGLWDVLLALVRS